MPKYTKPTNPNLIWANEALAADIVKPTDEQVSRGWIQQKPPFEQENWSINRLYRVYAYYNQLGIPEWDSQTEYQAGKSYVQGSDGLIYKAKVTNTGNNPAGSGGDRWDIAFLAHSSASSFGRSLIDDISAEQARQTLGLGSVATQDDIKYLHRTNNLSDVANASTAFNNIKQGANTERTGVVELATSQEVIEGVRNDVAVTPSSLGGMNPAGTVIQFAGDNAPGGYLECDGMLLSRSTYPNLFSAIGTRYGSTTTSNFRIPDLRGQFVRGWDRGRGLDNNRSMGSSQSGQVQAHSHSGSTNNGGYHSHSGVTNSGGYHSHSGITNNGVYHTHSGSTSTNGEHRHGIQHNTTDTSRGGNDTGGTGRPVNYTDFAGAHNHSLNINGNGSHRHSFTTNNTGGNETRPTNVALMYCIKT